MGSLTALLHDRMRPVVPAERLAAVRVVVGVFAVVFLVARAHAVVTAGAAHAPFSPVGVVRALSAPTPPWVSYVVLAVTLPLAVAFTVGFRYRITAPLFALGLLWLLTYRNSFGMVFHTENLLVLHALLLSVSDAAAAWSLDARRSPAAARPARRFGAALFTLSAVTVLTYTLAGIAKLRVAGLDWMSGDILKNHIAHDNVRKVLLGDGHSPLGAWLIRHPAIFPPFAAISVAMELLAPVALLSRRVGRWTCAILWGFHVGVLATMWILFPYPLFGIGFASFFDLDLLYQRLRDRLRKGAPAGESAPSRETVRSGETAPSDEGAPP